MSTTKQHITTETCKVSHGIGDWYLLLNPILIHIKLHIALTPVSGTRLEFSSTIELIIEYFSPHSFAKKFLPKVYNISVSRNVAESLQYFEKILKYGKRKC